MIRKFTVSRHGQQLYQIFAVEYEYTDSEVAHIYYTDSDDSYGCYDDH